MIFPEQNTDLFDVGEVELERTITLPIHAPLKEAISLIAGQEKGTPSSCILVEEQGLIVGILTERDLVRLSLSATTLQQTTVGEVMTHPVVTLDQDSLTDIFSVYSLMRRHRIRHLPILDQQTALGIVTITSLRQSLHLGYFLRFREVQEIMTHEVVTATSTMPVLDVAQLMAKNHISCVIVVENKAEIVKPVGYLQHFPFDSLKIDRCFVSNIHANPKNAAITTAIIRMAEQLGFSVVAEGVEQEAEMQFLRQRYCHIIQGYWVSRPLPPAECLKFIKNYIHHSAPYNAEGNAELQPTFRRS